MSEIGEIYKELKLIRDAESKERKERNKCNSMAMLDKNKISYEVKNFGVHLVVFGNGKIADFWPTTGKFCVRGTSNYRRGVRLLVKVMRGDHD